MGRQIHFYLLSEDRNAFLRYTQERDPVVIVPRDSHSRKIVPLFNGHIELSLLQQFGKASLHSVRVDYLVTLSHTLANHRHSSNGSIVSYAGYGVTTKRIPPTLAAILDPALTSFLRVGVIFSQIFCRRELRNGWPY